MPDTDQTTAIVLLAICLVLGLLTVALIVRISSRLSALERRLGGQSITPEATGETPSIAETSAGGAFELFLSEDPSRRELSKGEQFAAYRKWRQDKGMNWAAS